ncbi:MAG: nuclear transport factor 2 family protein [Candidatus Latescibacterota bacterium]
MSATPDTRLGAIYRQHLDHIRSRNVEGLLGQYAQDCLLISTLTEDRSPLYVRGHRELEAFFRSRIFSLEKLEVDLRQWAETDNTLMIVEEIAATGTDGSHSSLEFYDNWFLRDGHIAIHFAGTVRYPDGTHADGTGYPPGAAPAKSEPPDTALGCLYREHIGFIKSKNVEGILQQYAQDALLIGTLTEGRKPRFVRGRKELRDFFNGNFMGLQSLTSRIDQWAEAPEALMMVESVEVTTTDGARVDMSFYDNWVLQDGRIAVHYAGVVRYPDGSYA